MLNTMVDTLLKRRSVRDFKNQPVAPEHLELMLQAVRRAPTFGSLYLASVLHIDNPLLKQQLAELAGNQQHIADCGSFFVLLADFSRIGHVAPKAAFGTHNNHTIAMHFGTVEATLCGAALATMAEHLGYGTVWIGGILNDTQALVELLQLPRGMMPVAGVCVGVPNSIPPLRERIDGSLIWHHNHYQQPSPQALEHATTTMNSWYKHGSWAKVVKHYFGAPTHLNTGVLAHREVSYRKALEGL